MSEEILIVDDNADIRNIINELIIDAGYKTRLAANYNQGLAEIDKKLPDVAILDVKLDKGDNDGIELLSHIKSKNKDTPVIIISGHANIEMAVKSLQHGAFEFIEKPFDQERLLNFVKRAVENFNLKKQNKEYESKLFSSYELIGNSKNIVNIIDQIKKISLTESRVFISGPSGSGKELIARKIHKASNRSKNPFIVLNGALLDINKYELELFGEEKSNGSISYGALEKANKGTLLIDQVSEIPLNIQASRELYKNLFEAPLPFLVYCLFTYTVGHVTMLNLVLAWLYVAFRIWHYFVRMSNPKISKRRVPFQYSLIVTFILWTELFIFLVK